MKSLKQQLEEYQQQKKIPMHMPGHKRNANISPDLNNLSEQYDITEIEGFDNLHGAQGILKEAMERAAKCWNSERSYFLVNSSTCGILASIRALTKRGDRVLVARNCHKSVFHAIEICGLEPVFLLPPLMESGIFGSVLPKQIEETLNDYVESLKVLENAINYYMTRENLVSAYETGKKTDAQKYIQQNIKCDGRKWELAVQCNNEMNYYEAFLMDYINNNNQNDETYLLLQDGVLSGDSLLYLDLGVRGMQKNFLKELNNE